MLDTGVGTNIFNARVLPDSVLRNLHAAPAHHPLVDANNRPLNLQGKLTTRIELGHLRVRLTFFVVTRLAADYILGTTFIDKHVKAILPGSRSVAFYQGGRIAILGNTNTKHGWIKKPKQCLSSKTVSNKIGLTKLVFIPAMTQMIVPVTCAVPGLLLIQNHPRLADRHVTLMANGIIDNFPNIPFKVLLNKFRDHTVRLPKNTNVGIGLTAPQGIFSINRGLGEGATVKEGEDKTTEEFNRRVID